MDLPCAEVAKRACLNPDRQTDGRTDGRTDRCHCDTFVEHHSSGLNIGVDWLRTNRLSLNLKKTHAMVFGSKKKSMNSNPVLKIDNLILEIVKETTFLGIILDAGLTWKNHIAYTAKQIAKSIGILSKAKQFLNNKTLLQLYYSFVYPYLIYSNIIWAMRLKQIVGPFTCSKKSH
jgi:hypothetical protein